VQGGIYSLVDGGGGAAHWKVEAEWKRITSESRGGENIDHDTLSLHELE
jgi:hypothetical protein